MKQDRQKTFRTRLECLAFAPLVSQYIDGRLSTSMTWRIKNHVTVCESCADAVKSYNTISALLGNATKHQTSSAFDSSLESRIAALPRKSGVNAAGSHYLRSLMVGTSIRSISHRSFAGPIGIAVVSVVFAGFAFQHLVNEPISHPIYPATVVAPAIADPSLVQTCVNQHRTDDDANPLDDASAILLTSRVDSLPVNPDKNRSLNKDDAAVLLDEEM